MIQSGLHTFRRIRKGRGAFVALTIPRASIVLFSRHFYWNANQLIHRKIKLANFGKARTRHATNWHLIRETLFINHSPDYWLPADIGTKTSHCNVLFFLHFLPKRELPIDQSMVVVAVWQQRAGHLASRSVLFTKAQRFKARQYSRSRYGPIDWENQISLHGSIRIHTDIVGDRYVTFCEIPTVKFQESFPLMCLLLITWVW